MSETLSELLKDIQKAEDKCDIQTMERLTSTYVSATAPRPKLADVNYIGRNTYNFKGELISFYLEPIVKIR